MMAGLQIILYFIVILFSSITVVYSVKSRRASDVRARMVHAAKMNVSMGVMLLAIAAIQILLFPYSTLRLIFGTVCFLLGAFNLYAGIRNLLYFRSNTTGKENGGAQS